MKGDLVLKNFIQFINLFSGMQNHVLWFFGKCCEYVGCIMKFILLENYTQKIDTSEKH